MKRISLFLMAVIGIVSVAIAQPLPKKSVAVYVTGNNLTTVQRQIVNSAAVTAISRSKYFDVYERNEDFLNEVSNEHDFQLSGEVPLSEIRKIGNLYGVSYVVVILVTQDIDRTYVSGRLLDVETGGVVKSVNLDRKTRTNKELQNLTNNVVYRLVSKSYN